MKEDLIKILQKHNFIHEGLLISGTLEEYVEKLLNNANIIFHYDSGNLKGFIAYYKNDFIHKKAYLSMIIVDKDFQKSKIGSSLLDFSIQDLVNAKFKNYTLEVLKTNLKAISFYKKNDFEIIGENDNFYVMRKIITLV